jgi:serine/threonine protein kinase
MIGTVLHDRWRILSLLGRGGMGEVYLAEHIELGRKEALKILMPELARDPKFVSRFRREARAVNRLRHPNIIAIYDFGQLPDGRFYLAMEYAEGNLLDAVLRRFHRLDVTRTLHLLGQLAYASHHAHSRGVVHRDLKPGNMIVLAADETLKVLDFGLAKIVAPDHAESMAFSTGNVIWGTPKYMSPERLAGTGDDPRIDLYAIGCVAYELVIGEPPFVGTSDQIISGHLREPPVSPRTLRADIPTELEGVILRLLAKSAEQRFQSAAELFAALRRVPGYPPHRAEPRRRFIPLPRHPAELTPSVDERGHRQVRGALRELAEALLDLGLDEVRLVSGIARLRDHEQSLASLEAAQDALEHQAAALRETTGDRESSLRFALSELEFASTQPVPPRDLGERVSDLETRLADANRNTETLRALDDRIAAISAVRAQGVASVREAYDALERVVDAILPAYATHPTIAPLAHRRAEGAQLRATGRPPTEDEQS